MGFPQLGGPLQMILDKHKGPSIALGPLQMILRLPWLWGPSTNDLR